MWNKGNHMERRTKLERAQGRTAEIAIALGGATPLWTGNITKAWMWLLRWGNVPPQKKIQLIKEIRKILQQTTTENMEVSIRS